MVKTLLTRIKNIEQYDNANKTVLWEDITESRWTHDYGKLVLGDHIIFIGAEKLKGKLLIGDISQINLGQSILCSNIQEVECKNDQLLQLNEIYPELISRVKANFQPFIHSQEIDIPKLIDDANQKRFVSFYILSGIDKYNEISSSLNINDRVILFNPNNQFENVKIHSVTDLNDFSADLNIHISVEGKTLEEVLEKNKGIKRKSAKSNNLIRIKDIGTAIAERGSFKFTSFFAYYDTLYNKLVYHSAPVVSHLSLISLKSSETVFKVSMSGKTGEISDEAFNHFKEENLIVVHGKTKAKGTSSLTQGDAFKEQMKIGDYFYLCRGNDFLVTIGKITGDAEKCEYGDFGDQGWMQRSYEIVFEAIREDSYEEEQKWWTPNDNSTCIIIPKSEIKLANEKLFVPFFHTQFEYKAYPTTTNINPDTMIPPLNQILFGPPGTGKTYNTINKAIEIANPNFNLSQERTKVKEEFERLIKEGQVVFTTFHQSMDYEDFIEGIKPIKPKDKDTFLKYQIEDGIFKKACTAVITPYPLEHLYDLFLNDLEMKEILLETKTGSQFAVTKNGEKNLTISSGENFINRESSTSITKEKLLLNSESDPNTSYILPIKNYLVNNINYKKPLVFIIDEINRGNVSQIFGELITLIEEDKRQGKDEALEVILPYSKERFSVPSNLYIIGTMNTADRSVEAIDTALRRRFSFEEMPPKYDLPELEYDLAGIKGFEILLTLNKRIEKLLDKDHQIGHSYLMKNSDEDVTIKLLDSFYKKIIPLLQEYFFGDFGKIGLVLGRGFIKIKDWSENEDSFADFDHDSVSDFKDKDVFEIVDYHPGKKISYNIKVKNRDGKDIYVLMDFQKAIKLLMKQDIE